MPSGRMSGARFSRGCSDKRVYGVEKEFPVLLGAIYAGLLIGMLYDAFALLRCVLKRPWLIGLADGLFYAAALCLAALCLLYLNGGRPRLYALAGMLGGALFYRGTAGRLTRDLCGWLKRVRHKKASRRT